MLLELVGTEELSLELAGSIPARRARELLGNLEPETKDGRVAVGVLLFRMVRMRARGFPSPALQYGEALWRIGVLHGGAPAWFALRCDLDHPVVRTFGRTAIRYPVRDAILRFVDSDRECLFEVKTGEGNLHVIADPDTTPAPPDPPRRVLARANGRLYEIPWREDPPPRHNAAKPTFHDASLVQTTFGCDVAWEDRSLLLRGRTHRCGVARAVRV